MNDETQVKEPTTAVGNGEIGNGEPQPTQPSHADEAKPKRTFDQDELNTVVGERLKRERSQYEAKTSELEKRLAESERRNGELKSQIDAISERFVQMDEQNAFDKCDVPEEARDTFRYYLKGKGVEINAANIAKEQESHPEWKRRAREEERYAPSGSDYATIKTSGIVGNATKGAPSAETSTFVDRLKANCHIK